MTPYLRTRGISAVSAQELSAVTRGLILVIRNWQVIAVIDSSPIALVCDSMYPIET